MKKITILIVLLMVGFSLVACSNSSSGKDKNTLEIALWDENASEAVDASIEVFKKENPDIEVKVTYTPFAEYWTKLRTSLGGGSGPDIFWMNGPNFYEYVDSNLIENLESYIDDDPQFAKENYYETVLDLYSFEDELYAAPYFVDSIGLFYNKLLFDEAGVPYPDNSWTWEDIELYGEQLTNKEENIHGYVARIIGNQQGYYNLIPQAGGYIINEDKTQSGFNTSEAKEAFTFLQSLIDKGISPTVQNQIETKATQMFISERVAMLPEISVHAAEFHKELGDNLGVAPLPAGKEEGSVIHGIGWAMNSKSDNKELSWELIKSLSGEEGITTMAETGFSTPAHKEASQIWLESIPSIDLQVFLDAHDIGVLYPISKNVAEWQDVETKEIQSAFLGEQTIDEALEKISEQMNKVLEAENME
ncbi:ABC transporter substrate-binding protein [Oceanobacillus sp. E9]|uniref:sugar ABC transporter substrate-binding protein n=1 Tax=Oceanobacillus TaxID=182709 RepID=UPI00084E4B5E|nr:MULTISPECIES: sugar ABC transporter substrate-binding protein [Oceanobacillus]OEH56462.1 ABC transporter substrate-binding protein [Oceanobacillus sp. E9]